MKVTQLLLLLVLGAAGALLFTQLPELRRYLNIRSM
jgi:hypothetical protein